MLDILLCIIYLSVIALLLVLVGYEMNLVMKLYKRNRLLNDILTDRNELIDRLDDEVNMWYSMYTKISTKETENDEKIVFTFSHCPCHGRFGFCTKHQFRS